jgi:hypothetical protein
MNLPVTKNSMQQGNTMILARYNTFRLNHLYKELPYVKPQNLGPLNFHYVGGLTVSDK